MNKIDKYMKERGIERYTVNSDDSIDIEGDIVILENPIPFTFRKVSGDFWCCGVGLYSLQNAPLECRSLSCPSNNLMTLEFAPISCNLINIANNKLTSLRGCPKSLKILNCCSNRLTTLKYIPENIEQLYVDHNGILRIDKNFTNINRLEICDNQLIKLDGLPEKMNTLEASNNKLLTLKGCPKYIDGMFNIINNKELKSLKYAPTVKGSFYCDKLLKDNREYKLWEIQQKLS